MRINRNTALCLLLFLLTPCVLFAQNTSPNLLQYEGTYAFPGGEKITLGVFDEFNNSLVYLNLKTLRQGAFVHVKGDLFKDNNDTTLFFEFKRSGNKIASLQRTRQGKIDQGHRVTPHTREEISFTNKGRVLRGAFYLPERKGPHAVTVVAHPSGPATRGAAFFTTHFLHLGIGVLIFDKQGAGQSEGDWQTASFDELASDVVAAVEYAKTRKEVDVKKIGISGSSQAGWVGSIAASRSKDVSFLIIRAGSGENVLETISHEYKGILISEGLNEKEVAIGIKMFREHWTAAVKGASWEVGDSLYKLYKDEPWFEKIVGKRTKTERSLKWWNWLRQNLYYDSYDFVKELNIPILWFLSENDWNVNTPKSFNRLTAAKLASGNKDFTLKIIPGASHGGTTSKTGLPNEAFSWQYAKGFWDTTEAWLRQRRFAK